MPFIQNYFMHGTLEFKEKYDLYISSRIQAFKNTNVEIRHDYMATIWKMALLNYGT